MSQDIAKFLKRKKPVDEFTVAVIRLILAIPRGKVVTYGQLAELAGRPNCSRSVGFILRNVVKPEVVPWQRVIGANGRIAFSKRSKGFQLQRKLLEGEGVKFSGSRVDLDRYRWRRRPKTAKGRALPKMFSW